MSKKQTLASILGTTDSRKQVDLDLGTPALTPTVQRAGQYSVAVTPTPKTNSALQLAQALRVTPQILGQANNIAKKLGSEAAAEELDVESALADDTTKGILGYDKAYQQGLVKRHFAMNEEAIKERFMNLSRTEEALKQTPDEFLGAMAGERKQFVDELMEQFGGNENREQALQALTGAYVDELRDSATAEFVQNKKDQALMMVSADTMTLFNNQGVTAGLNYMASEMSAMAVDLKPSERAQKMRDAVTSNVSVSIEQGEFSKAAQVIADAEAYGIKGAGKLFGSAKGSKDMLSLKRALRSAREAVEVSFSDNSKGLGRSVDALLQDVADPDVSVEDRTASALRMAKRAGVSDEEAQAFAEAASVGGVDAMVDAYRDLARNATNENTRDLLNDQLGEINRAKKEYFGGNASTIGTFSPDDIADLKAQREEILMEDPNTPLTQLPTSVNGRKMNVEDDDYKALVREERRDFGWATSPSQLKDITKDTQRAITGKDNARSFGAYANEYGTALKNDLNEAAPALWRKAKYDVAEYDSLLQAEADKLFGQYQRRAELRGNTESLLDTNLSAEKEDKALKDASKSKTVRDMASFSASSASVADIIADRKTLVEMETGRRSVSSSDKRRLLQASLLSFGFPTMESLDLQMLSEANMGFEDVLLGDSVIREMIPALRGIEAGDEATPEQKAAIEKWAGYGFDSVEDFYRLEEAQETLRNLNNR
jgi:hypothetical protein